MATGSTGLPLICERVVRVPNLPLALDAQARRVMETKLQHVLSEADVG